MSIGMVYNDLGQYQDALAYHKQALKIIKDELDDHEKEGVVQINLGNVYDNLGRYQDALACYEQALKITREFSSPGGREGFEQPQQHVQHYGEISASIGVL